MSFAGTGQAGIAILGGKKSQTEGVQTWLILHGDTPFLICFLVVLLTQH